MTVPPRAIAMLVVLVALVSLLNQLLACLPAVGSAPLSLQRMLGWLMAPVVWLAGIPSHEAVTAGALHNSVSINPIRGNGAVRKPMPLS